MAIDYTQLISTAFAGGVAIYTDKKNRKNERQMRIDELNYALKMQSGDMYQTEGRDAANYANRPARYARYAGQGAVASTAALGSCAASAEFTPETIDAGWSIFIWGVVFAMVIFGVIGVKRGTKK